MKLKMYMKDLEAGRFFLYGDDLCAVIEKKKGNAECFDFTQWQKFTLSNQVKVDYVTNIKVCEEE